MNLHAALDNKVCILTSILIRNTGAQEVKFIFVITCTSDKRHIAQQVQLNMKWEA